MANAWLQELIVEKIELRQTMFAWTIAKSRTANSQMLKLDSYKLRIDGRITSYTRISIDSLTLPRGEFVPICELFNILWIFLGLGVYVFY